MGFLNWLWEPKRKHNDMVKRAKEIDEVIVKIGIPDHSKVADELRGICALEILGRQYETVDKYSKATFLKSVDNEEMKRLLEMLREEGLLNKKGAKLLEQK